MTASLHVRNYRLFWFSQLVSLSGTWMQIIGQSWLVLELTHSPQALGIVTMLQFLPLTLLSLFAGVIADRVSKRRFLVFTQSMAMLQALVLGILVATGVVQIWHVYILAALLGLNNAFDNPTRQAFVSEMVGKDLLPNAVALNSTLFNTARIVARRWRITATVGITACSS
jgi:MFS family permease